MARRHADIAIRVRVGDDKNCKQWEYELHFAQDAFSSPRIKRERVVRQGKAIAAKRSDSLRRCRDRLKELVEGG